MDDDQRQTLQQIRKDLEGLRPLLDQLRAAERDLLLPDPLPRLQALHKLGTRLLNAMGSAETPMHSRGTAVAATLLNLSPYESWVVGRFAWAGITDAMDRGVAEVLDRLDAGSGEGASDEE